MKISFSLKDFNEFFEETIWDVGQDLPWWKDLWFGLCRFGYLFFSGITKNRTAIRATALAYTTLLSIVPVIAVMMAFTKAFGGFAKIETLLEPIILDNLTEGSGEIVRKYLINFSHNLNAGTLGLVGIIFLVLTVIGLLSTIEAAFNDIWGIRTQRPVLRRLMAYWTLVTIGPLCVAISIGMTASLQSTLMQHYFLVGEYAGYVFKGLPYVVTWILFTMLYSFMPNTHVRLRSAFLGGILAGTLWEFAKYGYAVYAAKAVSYSAIYGSLGALPIFLIWLYLTWVIVLLGAEISFAHQNLKTYREERRTSQISQEFKEFLALNLVAFICSQFSMKKGAVTTEQITDEFKIPVRLINEVLFNLCTTGIILAMGDEKHYYCPGMPLEKITIKEILGTLRSIGEAPPRFKMTRYEKYFKEKLSEIDQCITKISSEKNFKEIVSDLSSSYK